MMVIMGPDGGDYYNSEPPPPLPPAPADPGAATGTAAQVASLQDAVNQAQATYDQDTKTMQTNARLVHPGLQIQVDESPSDIFKAYQNANDTSIEGAVTIAVRGQMDPSEVMDRIRLSMDWNALQAAKNKLSAAQDEMQAVQAGQNYQPSVSDSVTVSTDVTKALTPVAQQASADASAAQAKVLVDQSAEDVTNTQIDQLFTGHLTNAARQARLKTLSQKLQQQLATEKADQADLSAAQAKGAAANVLLYGEQAQADQTSAATLGKTLQGQGVLDANGQLLIPASKLSGSQRLAYDDFVIAQKKLDVDAGEINFNIVQAQALGAQDSHAQSAATGAVNAALSPLHLGPASKDGKWAWEEPLSGNGSAQLQVSAAQEIADEATNSWNVALAQKDEDAQALQVVELKQQLAADPHNAQIQSQLQKAEGDLSRLDGKVNQALSYEAKHAQQYVVAADKQALAQAQGSGGDIAGAQRKLTQDLQMLRIYQEGLNAASAEVIFAPQLGVVSADEDVAGVLDQQVKASETDTKQFCRYPDATLVQAENAALGVVKQDMATVPVSAYTALNDNANLLANRVLDWEGQQIKLGVPGAEDDWSLVSQVNQSIAGNRSQTLSATIAAGGAQSVAEAMGAASAIEFPPPAASPSGAAAAPAADSASDPGATWGGPTDVPRTDSTLNDLLANLDLQFKQLQGDYWHNQFDLVEPENLRNPQNDADARASEKAWQAFQKQNGVTLLDASTQQALAHLGPDGKVDANNGLLEIQDDVYQLQEVKASRPWLEQAYDGVFGKNFGGHTQSYLQGIASQLQDLLAHQDQMSAAEFNLQYANIMGQVGDQFDSQIQSERDDVRTWQQAQDGAIAVVSSVAVMGLGGLAGAGLYVVLSQGSKTWDNELTVKEGGQVSDDSGISLAAAVTNNFGSGGMDPHETSAASMGLAMDAVNATAAVGGAKFGKALEEKAAARWLPSMVSSADAAAPEVSTTGSWLGRAAVRGANLTGFEAIVGTGSVASTGMNAVYLVNTHQETGKQAWGQVAQAGASAAFDLAMAPIVANLGYGNSTVGRLFVGVLGNTTLTVGYKYLSGGQINVGDWVSLATNTLFSVKDGIRPQVHTVTTSKSEPVTTELAGETDSLSAAYRPSPNRLSPETEALLSDAVATQGDLADPLRPAGFPTVALPESLRGSPLLDSPAPSKKLTPSLALSETPTVLAVNEATDAALTEGENLANQDETDRQHTHNVDEAHQDSTAATAFTRSPATQAESRSEKLTKAATKVSSLTAVRDIFGGTRASSDPPSPATRQMGGESGNDPVTDTSSDSAQGVPVVIGASSDPAQIPAVMSTVSAPAQIPIATEASSEPAQISVEAEGPSDPAQIPTAAEALDDSAQVVPVVIGASSDPAQVPAVMSTVSALAQIPITTEASSDPAQVVPVVIGASSDPAQIPAVMSTVSALAQIPITTEASSDPAQVVPVVIGASSDPAQVPAVMSTVSALAQIPITTEASGEPAQISVEAEGPSDPAQIPTAAEALDDSAQVPVVIGASSNPAQIPAAMGTPSDLQEVPVATVAPSAPAQVLTATEHTPASPAAEAPGSKSRSGALGSAGAKALDFARNHPIVTAAGTAMAGATAFYDPTLPINLPIRVLHTLLELGNGLLSYNSDSADYGIRAVKTVVQETTRRAWYWPRGVRLLNRIGPDGLSERDQARLTHAVNQYATSHELDVDKAQQATKSYVDDMATSKQALQGATETGNVDAIMHEIANQTTLTVKLQTALKAEPKQQPRLGRRIDALAKAAPGPGKPQKKFDRAAGALMSDATKYADRYDLDVAGVQGEVMDYIQATDASRQSQQIAKQSNDSAGIETQESWRKELSAALKDSFHVTDAKASAIATTMAGIGTTPVDPANPLTPEQRLAVALFTGSRGPGGRAVAAAETYAQRVGEGRVRLESALRDSDPKAVAREIHQQVGLRNKIGKRLGAHPTDAIVRKVFDPWKNNLWVKGTSDAIHAFAYGANVWHSFEYLGKSDFTDDWKLATNAHFGWRPVTFGWADLGDNLAYILPTGLMTLHYSGELIKTYQHVAGEHFPQLALSKQKAQALDDFVEKLNFTIESSYFPACLAWTVRDATTGFRVPNFSGSETFKTEDTVHLAKVVADALVTWYCVPLSYMARKGGDDSEIWTAKTLVSNNKPNGSFASDFVSGVGIVVSDSYRPHVRELVGHMGHTLSDRDGALKIAATMGLAIGGIWSGASGSGPGGGSLRINPGPSGANPSSSSFPFTQPPGTYASGLLPTQLPTFYRPTQAPGASPSAPLGQPPSSSSASPPGQPPSSSSTSPPGSSSGNPPGSQGPGTPPGGKPNSTVQYVVLAAGGLHVRSSPSTQASIVGNFRDGSFVQSTGETSTDSAGVQWTYVTSAGSSGWIQTQYLESHPEGGQGPTGRDDPTLAQQGFRAVTVLAGDTLTRIAHDHHVDLQEVLDLAQRYIVDPNEIFPGDQVYLPNPYARSGMSVNSHFLERWE